jgi:hypothetical protein
LTQDSDAGAPRPPAPLTRRRLVWLAIVFVGVPAVVFGLPAALGVPWLAGDNLIQNYPLRVLVGADLRAGHLPLWDPYVWSGSPLLAGFNAGAAYPLTWLFALPGRVPAWVVGQVASVAVAGSGTFFLLRGQGRSFRAAVIGAAAFCFGGFVTSQSVHVDLVEAAGWLVWAFVALDRLARRPAGRPALRSVALLGVSLGLMGLTGAVEPLLDGGVALVLYAAWLVGRARGRRLALVAGLAAGAALGALVSAAQLLPGSLLQAQSQRGAHSYWYFTSGSMNKSLTVLLLDPLLLGGAHSAPLSYIGTYNLPEISGYVGIMAVMGAVGLLARRHRRSPEASRWWVWYLIAGVGLVLVWGDFTPLGHLEYLVPLYNRQRLLSRNWLEVDLALVVLFAAWLDHMLFAPSPDESPGAGPGRRWSSDVVLPLLPVGGVVVLQVILVAGGAWFPHVLHVPQPVSYGVLWGQDLFLCIPSAIAVSAGWTLLRRARLGPRVGKVAAWVVAADLLLFNAMVQSDPQLHTAATTPSPADVLAAVVAAAPGGPGGRAPRFALYDPDRYDAAGTEEVGQPDLNVLRSLSSVQGYGALVDAAYDRATATHQQGDLAVAGLADGSLAALDLGVLLAPPQYFASPLGAAPGLGAASAFAPPTGAVSLGPGASRTWFFGTVLDVAVLDLPVSGPARLRVGLLDAGGSGTRWLEGPAGAEAAGGSLELPVPGAPASAGVVVERLDPTAGPARLEVGPALVHTVAQGTYRLDGGLRDAVAPPRWRFAGSLDGFAVFEEQPQGAATLEPADAGSARVVSAPPWGSDRIEVHSRAPALLVRDVTWASGWRATLSPVPAAPGRARPLPVLRHGLVQAVRVPAGTHVVSFSYRPGRAVAALALSGAGVVVAAGLALAGRPPRRRRPSGPGRRRAAARRAGPRSAGAPGGATPALRGNAPEAKAASPLPRAP